MVAYMRRAGATEAILRANVRVRIVGIGMFDSLRGETGEAPNGIQLSPVLDIAFGEERMPVNPVSRPHHSH
jgi:hypothetical protein